MEYKNYFQNQNPYEIIENYVVNLGNVIGPTGPGNVLDGTNDNNILIWDDTNNTWKQNEEEQTKIKNNIYSNNISLASSGRSNFVSEDLKNGNWTYMNMGDVYNETDKNDNPESGILFHSNTSGNSGYNAYIGSWKDNISGLHSNIRMDIGSLSNVRNLGNTTDNAISWPDTPAVSIRPAINKVGINHVPSTSANETLTVGGSTKIDDDTPSTDTTSGALTVAGGAGIASNLNVGGNLGVTGSATLEGSLTLLKTDDSTPEINLIRGDGTFQGDSTYDYKIKNDGGHFEIERGTNISNRQGNVFEIGHTSIKLGNQAGYTNQNTNDAIAIGDQAGYDTQGSFSVAVGGEAGYSDQGTNSVAIGRYAGKVGQKDGHVAIGYEAGYSNQLTSGGNNSVAIGRQAGYSNQNYSSVAIGSLAGSNTQGYRSIAIGEYAGQSTQGDTSIALGFYSGEEEQGNESVAIGANAGKTSQKNFAVALGSSAGRSNQADFAVGVGRYAGSNAQGTGAVAIGYAAGSNNQGQNSVAIGRGAGNDGLKENTIVISSLGANWNPSSTGFYVNDLRSLETVGSAKIMYFDDSSKEIRYRDTKIAERIIKNNIKYNPLDTYAGGQRYWRYLFSTNDNINFDANIIFTRRFESGVNYSDVVEWRFTVDGSSINAKGTSKSPIKCFEVYNSNSERYDWNTYIHEFMFYKHNDFIHIFYKHSDYVETRAAGDVERTYDIEIKNNKSLAGVEYSFKTVSELNNDLSAHTVTETSGKNDIYLSSFDESTDFASFGNTNQNIWMTINFVPSLSIQSHLIEFGNPKIKNTSSNVTVPLEDRTFSIYSGSGKKARINLEEVYPDSRLGFSLQYEASGNDFEILRNRDDDNFDVVDDKVLTITRDEGDTTIHHNLEVKGDTSITNPTVSGGTTSGALKVSGGVGIAKNLNVGSNVNATIINASDELVYKKSDTSNVKITNVQGGVGLTFNQNTNTNDKRFDIFQTSAENDVYMRYNSDTSPSLQFNKPNDRIYLKSDEVRSSGRILYQPETNKEIGIAGPQNGLGLWLKPDTTGGTNRFDITNLGNTTRFEYNVNSVLEPSLEFNKSDNKISLDSDDVNINANTNVGSNAIINGDYLRLNQTTTHNYDWTQTSTSVSSTPNRRVPFNYSSAGNWNLDYIEVEFISGAINGGNSTGDTINYEKLTGLVSYYNNSSYCTFREISRESTGHDRYSQNRIHIYFDTTNDKFYVEVIPTYWNGDATTIINNLTIKLQSSNHQPSVEEIETVTTNKKSHSDIHTKISNRGGYKKEFDGDLWATDGDIYSNKLYCQGNDVNGCLVFAGSDYEQEYTHTQSLTSNNYAGPADNVIYYYGRHKYEYDIGNINVNEYLYIDLSVSTVVDSSTTQTSTIKGYLIPSNNSTINYLKYVYPADNGQVKNSVNTIIVSSENSKIIINYRLKPYTSEGSMNEVIKSQINSLSIKHRTNMTFTNGTNTRTNTDGSLTGSVTQFTTSITDDLNVHKNSAKLDIYDNTSGSTSQVLKASSSGIFSEAIRGTAAADGTSSNNKTVKYNSVTGEFYIE